MSLHPERDIARAQDASLLNRLRSIVHDAGFVSEIAQLHPRVPLVANLRAGLW